MENWYFIVGAVGGILLLLFIIYLISVLISPTVNYVGKHVLITGGSQGIGLEVALEYVRQGAHVTIAARNIAQLELAAEQLKAVRISQTQIVRYVAIDVSRGIDEVKAALDPIVQEVGHVHTIVNSAGIFSAREFSKTSQKEFERMINVNVLGSIYATHAVVDGMMSHKGGRIVFIASQVAHVSIYGYSAYGASKWALRGLAESLQMELRPYGIYVSVSYPPDTDTPGYKIEMLDKPEITKKLSESGVFSPESIAKDIVYYSKKGYFAISNGFDGWMLKQLHPGMSPVNNIWEVTQQILFCSLFRIVSLFYILSWDSIIKEETDVDAVSNSTESPISSVNNVHVETSSPEPVATSEKPKIKKSSKNSKK